MNGLFGLQVDARHRVALFSFCGRMTASTGRRAFLDYLQDEGFDPSHTLFWDVRRADIVADFAGIFGAVQSLKTAFARFPGEVLAVILVRDTLQFGMARMLQQIVEIAAPIRIEIVETEAEACRHLAMGPDELRALLPEPAAE